jgi:hypothetical protein
VAPRRGIAYLVIVLLVSLAGLEVRLVPDALELVGEAAGVVVGEVLGWFLVGAVLVQEVESGSWGSESDSAQGGNSEDGELHCR